MRTQLRAVCPACFAVQAVRNGLMVQHGYRRPQHWHQNVGTCSGMGKAHFGTERGRAYTATLATSLRDLAANRDRQAEQVVAGTSPVWGRKRLYGGTTVPVEIENPTMDQRTAYARNLSREASSILATAVELETRVASWQPAEPVEVSVETKTFLLHWRTNRMWHGQGKACAGSLMGSLKGDSTTDTKIVTCEKCKALIAKWEHSA